MASDEEQAGARKTGAVGDNTRDELDVVHHAFDAPKLPAAVVVFSGGQPVLRVLPIAPGGLEVGRLTVGGDEIMSRLHACIDYREGRFSVADLGSRNGTFVGGRRVEHTSVPAGAVVRCGRTLILLKEIAPLGISEPRAEEDGVIGAIFGAALVHAARAASSGGSLLVTGESGTGKERIARAFHAAAAPAGPFVAVNCATIPEALAERLLFGTVKGAYTGASADSPGYIAAGHGGTLFLDEIGELAPAVQAKLLRVLETREIQPLGAVRSRTVTTRFCFATLRDLRGASTFRQDLYFRIAQTHVVAPALRDRAEDIPWLVAWEARRVGDLAPHLGLVEECLLRPWPGNVRELLAAVRTAARSALLGGEHVIRADGLGATSGQHPRLTTDSDRVGDPRYPPLAEAGSLPPTAGGSPSPAAADAVGLMRRAILAALEKTNWVVSGERGAARLLGVKPTTLESRMKKLGITRGRRADRDEAGETTLSPDARPSRTDS